MAQPQRDVKYVVGGALTAAVGMTLAVLFALQPWRVCPEDGDAAGCRALPQDTAGLSVGLILFMVGFVLLVAGARMHRQR
jgi:hypothetical protein